MIRALISALILTGIAAHFGMPADEAAGYSIVGCLAVWFLWPALRTIARLLTRLARRGRRLWRTRRPNPTRRPATTAARTTAASTAAPAPGLTQINHHYHFYGATPQMSRVINPDQLALPRQTVGQVMHNKFYDAVNPDL